MFILPRGVRMIGAACLLFLSLAARVHAEAPLILLDEANDRIQEKLYTLKSEGIMSFRCRFQSDEIDAVLAQFGSHDNVEPALMYGWIYDSATKTEKAGRWLEGVEENIHADVFAELARKIPWDLEFFLGFSVGEGPRGLGKNDSESGDTPWNHELLQVPRLMDGMLVYQFENDAYLWIDPRTMKLVKMKGLLDNDPRNGILAVTFDYLTRKDRFLLSRLNMSMPNMNDIRLRIEITHADTGGMAIPEHSDFSIFNAITEEWDPMTSIYFRDATLNGSVDPARFFELQDSTIETIGEEQSIITLPISGSPLSVTFDEGDWQQVDSIGGQLEGFFDVTLQYGPGFAFFGALVSDEPSDPETLLERSYPNIDVERETRRDYLSAGPLEAIVIELDAAMEGEAQPVNYVCVFASDGELSYVIYAWAPRILPRVVAAVHELISSIAYGEVLLDTPAPPVTRPEKPATGSKGGIIRPPGLEL